MKRLKEQEIFLLSSRSNSFNSVKFKKSVAVTKKMYVTHFSFLSRMQVFRGGELCRMSPQLH